MAQDLSPLLPEKVKVSYAVRACGGSPSDAFPKVYEKTINLSDITFGDPTITPQPKGVKDTVFVIRDTALALYSAPAGPATNQAALDDLAKQLTTDFYNFRSIAFTKVYNGVIPVSPNGLIDLMEFDYSATEQSTRIQTAPWHGEPTEHNHQDSSVSMCQDFDRNPGIHVDIPGGASGTSMLGVLSLEDGRLVMTYDQTASVPCECTTTPACATICASVTGCSSAVVTGATVTVGYKGIASIARTAAGSGYVSTPTVVISTANGSGGAAIALLTATTVNIASGTATVAGSGYTSIPSVALNTPAGQTGSGATATCTMAVAGGTAAAAGSGYLVNDLLTISGGTSTSAGVLRVTAVDGLGGVTAVSVNTIGNYSVLPANPVSVTGGTGTAATFNLTWKLNTLTVTNAGSGYSAQPTVVFTGGGGSGAAGTVLLTATTLASISVTAPGIYHTAPGITFSGGGGSGATATATLTSITTTVGTCTTTGQIIGVTINNAGSGYTSAPTVAFSGGGGTGAAGTVNLNTTTVASFSVTNGGANYTATPAVNVTGGGGTGATGRALLTATTVDNAITVTNGGAGYTLAPTVVFTTPTGQTGSGAAATANLTGNVVTSITLTNAGTNYSGQPTISFTGGGGGAGATATCVLTATTLASITRTSAGSGYTSTPSVSVTGGNGAGATATATINTFTVSSVTMTNKGSGYTSAPSVSFSGGAGSGAAGTAVRRVQCCIPVTTAGGYIVTGAATNYTTTSTNVTLATCVDNSPTVALTAATGFTCTHSGCCPTSEDPTPPFVEHFPPATIFANDGVGTVTMTSSNPTAGVGVATWTGCATRTAGTGIPNCAFPATSAPNVPVTVYFQLTCSTFGTFQFDISVGGCGVGANCTGNPPADTMQCSGIPTGSHCQTHLQSFPPIACLPSFSATTSFSGLNAGGGGAGFFYIYGTGLTVAFSG